MLAWLPWQWATVQQTTLSAATAGAISTSQSVLVSSASFGVTAATTSTARSQLVSSTADLVTAATNAVAIVAFNASTIDTSTAGSSTISLMTGATATTDAAVASASSIGGFLYSRASTDGVTAGVSTGATIPEVGHASDGVTTSAACGSLVHFFASTATVLMAASTVSVRGRYGVSSKEGLAGASTAGGVGRFSTVCTTSSSVAFKTSTLALFTRATTAGLTTGIVNRATIKAVGQTSYSGTLAAVAMSRATLKADSITAGFADTSTDAANTRAGIWTAGGATRFTTGSQAQLIGKVIATSLVAFRASGVSQLGASTTQSAFLGFASTMWITVWRSTVDGLAITDVWSSELGAFGSTRAAVLTDYSTDVVKIPGRFNTPNVGCAHVAYGVKVAGISAGVQVGVGGISVAYSQPGISVVRLHPKEASTCEDEASLVSG